MKQLGLMNRKRQIDLKIIIIIGRQKKKDMTQK